MNASLHFSSTIYISFSFSKYKYHTVPIISMWWNNLLTYDCVRFPLVPPCKILTRSYVWYTVIFLSLSKYPCKLFSPSLAKQGPAGIHALRSASPCSWLHPSPSVPPSLPLFFMCLSFLLASSPILISFLLLIAPRLLPVEVNMIGVYVFVCICVHVWAEPTWLLWPCWYLFRVFQSNYT